MSDTPPADDFTADQRALLRLLHYLLTHAGQRNVTYRYCRQEIYQVLNPASALPAGRFQWGFETQFKSGIAELRELGLLTIAYGTSTIMAGKGGSRQMYSLTLTESGVARGAALAASMGAYDGPSAARKQPAPDAPAETHDTAAEPTPKTLEGSATETTVTQADPKPTPGGDDGVPG